MTQTDTTRTILLVVLAVLAIPVVMMLVMMPMMGAVGWSHMHGGMWDGSSGWAAMMGLMVLPLLIIIGIGYLLYQSLGTEGDGRSDEAIEELRRAYARGEISDEEFENRRTRLQNQEG